MTSDTATASDIIENGEWTPSLRCAIVIHYKSIYSMGGWTHETTARGPLSLSLLVTHSRVAGGIKVKEAWQKTEKRLHPSRRVAIFRKKSKEDRAMYRARK